MKETNQESQKKGISIANGNAFESIHESPIQCKSLEAPSYSNSLAKSNGLPHQLKSNMESMSGISLDDVNVHYNSSKPVQLKAHAYAQGNDIHLASGQEKHLAHEAWHTVQQKQGRVQPTTQLKGKAEINDDEGLEKEADVMGQKAIDTPIQRKPYYDGSRIPLGSSTNNVVQRYAIGDAPDQEDVGNEGQNNLLYGLNFMRMNIEKRLGLGRDSKSTYTIDVMNSNIGINGNFKNMSVIIKLVRRAMKDPENWKKYLGGNFNYPTKKELNDHYEKDNPFQLDRHQLWMNYLVKNSKHIGLYDMTDGPKAKKTRKRKLAKNQSVYDDQQTNQEKVAKYLSKFDHVKTDKLKTKKGEFNNLNEEVSANTWLMNAFFRRTSKLGMQFTVEEMNSNIFFNLAAGVKNADGYFDNEHNHIRTMAEQGNGNNNRRNITESEYRFMKKRKNDPLTQDLYNNNVKEYSELKDEEGN